MNITKHPEQYGSVFKDACFKIAASPEEVVDIRIYDESNQLVIGQKRYSGSAAYDVNVASYARQQIDVTPLKFAQSQFAHPTKRLLSTTIRSAGVSGSVLLHGGKEHYHFFSKLSQCPAMKPIAITECDEIAFLCDNTPLAAEVVLKGKSVEYEWIVANTPGESGLLSLYLNMENLSRRSINEGFGALESYSHIEVRILSRDEIFFSQSYRIVPSTPESVRICWWNSHGQIDYYTLNKATQKEFLTEKQRILTPEGYRSISHRTETKTTLCSDFIPEEELMWLCEMIHSPRVWIVSEGGFLPIEILSDTVVCHAHRLNQLQIICSMPETTLYPIL